MQTTHYFKSLIDRAIRIGWIRRSPKPELKMGSYMRRETRAKWHTRGLNSRGRPRRNIPRPELAGLNRQTYHREYMRIWRNRTPPLNETNTQHATRNTHFHS